MIVRKGCAPLKMSNEPNLGFVVSRHRRGFPLIAMVFAGHVLAQAAAEPQIPVAEKLYVLSVNKNGSAVNGKPTVMNFQEIKREAESSLVEVKLSSGDGQAAWQPMLQGMCGLMHARQHINAVSEQVSVQPLRFRLTFPSNPKIDDRPGLPRLVLTEKECAAINR